MPPREFLLVVFCRVDDELKALDLPPLRSRGPRPKLADSEVIAIEIAGEFWGHADDRAIYRHFRRYHAAEFPALAAVDRSSFVRQAANLCWLKRRLQRRLAGFAGRPGPGQQALDLVQAARFCRMMLAAPSVSVAADERHGWPALLSGAAAPELFDSGRVRIPFASLRVQIQARGDSALADVPGLLERLDVPQLRELWPAGEVSAGP